MTVSKTSIDLFFAVFLFMAFFTHADGGGKSKVYTVAEACENVSRNFSKVHFTKDFCMTALKPNQNKSADAKDYRHLALVSADVLKGAVISNVAKIEAMLPGKKNDKASTIGLRLCRVEYSAVPRILQICSNMIMDYGIRNDAEVSSGEVFSCVDRVDTANKKCMSDISDTSVAAHAEFAEENKKVAVLVSLTNALIEQLTGDKHGQ